MQNLTIDYREKSLIEHLVELKVPHNTQNLEIGDILCTYPDFKLCLERKTWSDLWASIKDGRYREQRSRLQEWSNNHQKVMYIIEGEPKEFDNQDTCMRTLHRLPLLYGMGVWKTKSVVDTAKYLQWMYGQKSMFDSVDPHQAQITQLADSMTKKKKDVQSPSNFCHAILQSITGISYDIVKYICPPPIESLQAFITNAEKQGIKLLSEIVIPTKSGKSRKFGLEKSRRVFETLGIPYEEPKK